MYVVYFEGARPETFRYIRDAAEAWCSYPYDLECMVMDEHGNEIPKETLEGILGYKKGAPCPRIPRPRTYRYY